MWATSLLEGEAWGEAFRQDDGDVFGWPWRVVLCGDPLFCLRDEPARRRTYRPADGPLVRTGERLLGMRRTAEDAESETWGTRMREARWRGDHATAQRLIARVPPDPNAAELVLVLEEQLRSGDAIGAWRHWSKANDEGRRHLLAALCARQGACALLGHALAEGNLENTLSAFDAFMLTGPSVEATICWLDRLAQIARSMDQLPVFAGWLARRATDPGLRAYRKAFQECATRIGQDALGNGKNGP